MRHATELHGDLAIISIGKFCGLGVGAVIRPPPKAGAKAEDGAAGHIPLKIGEHVEVGARTVVEAAAIGSCVQIGSDCVIVGHRRCHRARAMRTRCARDVHAACARLPLPSSPCCFLPLEHRTSRTLLCVLQGPRCILRDCCCLQDGTVLAADTVVPPFAMFGGSPGVLICELPECTPELFQEKATNAFERFKPRPKAS